MKNLVKLSMALFLFGTALVSCKKDKQELMITDLVAENHNGGGKEIPRGGTISINFTATAGDEARLDYYHIELHDHPTSGLVEDEYRIIDESFKNKATFKGLKNASVHEHVVVADTANLGAYHVVIVVVDEEGNSVDTEAGNTEIVVVE